MLTVWHQLETLVRIMPWLSQNTFAINFCVDLADFGPCKNTTTPSLGLNLTPWVVQTVRLLVLSNNNLQNSCPSSGLQELLTHLHQSSRMPAVNFLGTFRYPKSEFIACTEPNDTYNGAATSELWWVCFLEPTHHTLSVRPTHFDLQRPHLALSAISASSSWNSHNTAHF